MRRVLSENIELTFKMGAVERTTLAKVVIAIVGAQDDERLKNGGFFATSSRTQNISIGGDLSPTKHT
jgi:hypothetical protein